MQVIKRDGKTVDYDNFKIRRAIGNAWLEIYDSVDEKALDKVLFEVESRLKTDPQPLAIHRIQDLVELELMAVEPELTQDIYPQKVGERDGGKLLQGQ